MSKARKPPLKCPYCGCTQLTKFGSFGPVWEDNKKVNNKDLIVIWTCSQCNQEFMATKSNKQSMEVFSKEGK